MYGGLAVGILLTLSCSESGSSEAAREKPSAPESVVLARETASTPSTAFTLMSPDLTGIDFANRWQPSEEERRELGQAATGGGVAIGDLDGDGLPDLVLSRSHGGLAHYRNGGNWRFEDVTASSGLDATAGDWTVGPSLADVDGDGDLDLFVAVHRRGSNRLFLNDGSGVFVDGTRAAGLELTTESISGAWADYDNDGDLDLYLVNNYHDLRRVETVAIDPETGKPYIESGAEYLRLQHVRGDQYAVFRVGRPDVLYRNNGDGTFVDVSKAAGIGGEGVGLSAVWWDANQDGWPDLFVANDFKSADYVYINRRDGTFTDAVETIFPHIPWASMGSAVGDLNNDGLIDLIGTDMAGTSHYRDKIGMGDMSDDAWFLNSARPPQYMRNAVYLNTATRHFREAASLLGLAKTNWTWSVKIQDLDSDGHSDVFFTNGMTRDWNNSDYLIDEPKPDEPDWLPFWENKPPLAERNLCFRNGGDLQFEDVSEEWGLDNVSVSHGAAFGDLDGDGDLDLVVNRWDEETLVYQNESSGHHLVKIALEGRGGNPFGIGARVEIEAGGIMQSRYLTPVCGFVSCDEPVLHFGLGEAERIDRLSVTWVGGETEVYEDLEGDRFYRIVQGGGRAGKPLTAPSGEVWFDEVRPEFTRIKQVEVPYDDYERQPLLPNRQSQFGPDMAWGDLNGDGLPDLAMTGSAEVPDMIFFNRGKGQFDKAVDDFAQADAACETADLLFFDADGDSDLDLYAVSGGVQCSPGDEVLRDRLYLNDGDGQLSVAKGCLPDLAASGSVAVASDFDGDGDEDLFIGGRGVPGDYPMADRSQLLRNDGGKFTDVTPEELRTPGIVTDALWADLDGDAVEDLVLAIEWGSPIIFLNRNGSLEAADFGTGELKGWWKSVAAGDFDGDGDIDLVLGNAGLNTKYHPDPEHPSLIFYGDLDGSGKRNIVEAKSKGKDAASMLPVRGRSCSSGAMNVLAERFPTFDLFARASLEEIYGDDRLSKAERFEVTTPESGVLINEGGRMRFQPLPRIAQIAPASAIVVEDLNADGRLDIFLAQNFFGPQLETGRFDGGVGQVLRGLGDGSFEEVTPREAGISIRGDATDAMAVDVDGDGRLDLVISRNEEPVAVYRNRLPGAQE